MLGLTGKELKHPEQIDSLLTCSAKLFRTDIIKENHIEWIDRKVIYSDCLDYILKYVYRCRSVVYIDKPLYYYVRTNTESQTASYRPFTIELWQYQFAELEKFITRHIWKRYWTKPITPHLFFRDPDRRKCLSDA